MKPERRPSPTGLSVPRSRGSASSRGATVGAVSPRSAASGGRYSQASRLDGRYGAEAERLPELSEGVDMSLLHGGDVGTGTGGLVGDRTSQWSPRASAAAARDGRAALRPVRESLVHSHDSAGGLGGAVWKPEHASPDTLSAAVKSRGGRQERQERMASRQSNLSASTKRLTWSPRSASSAGLGRTGLAASRGGLASSATAPFALELKIPTSAASQRSKSTVGKQAGQMFDKFVRQWAAQGPATTAPVRVPAAVEESPPGPEADAQDEPWVAIDDHPLDSASAAAAPTRLQIAAPAMLDLDQLADQLDVVEADLGGEESSSVGGSASADGEGDATASEIAFAAKPPSATAIEGMRLLERWKAQMAVEDGAAKPLCFKRTADQVDEQHGHMTLHTFQQSLQFEQLILETGYNRGEIIALFIRFKALCALSSHPNGIDKATFRRGTPLLAVEDRLFSDRVYDVLDDDRSLCISWGEYIEAMSCLEKGSWDKRLDFVFKVYDDDGDGFISAPDMFKFFVSSLRVDLNDHIREMAENWVTELIEKLGCTDKQGFTLADAKRYLENHPHERDVFAFFGRTMSGQFAPTSFLGDEEEDAEDEGVSAIREMQRKIQQANELESRKNMHLHDDHTQESHEIPTLIPLNKPMSSVAMSSDQVRVSMDWNRLASLNVEDEEDAEKLVVTLRRTATDLKLDVSELGEALPPRKKRDRKPADPHSALKKRLAPQLDSSMDPLIEEELEDETPGASSRGGRGRRRSVSLNPDLQSTLDYAPRDDGDVAEMAMSMAHKFNALTRLG